MSKQVVSSTRAGGDIVHVEVKEREPSFYSYTHEATVVDKDGNTSTEGGYTRAEAIERAVKKLEK